MTRELAMVHAREGIRLNSICPYVSCHSSSDNASYFFFLYSGPLKTRELLLRLLIATRLIFNTRFLLALLMDFLNTAEKRDRRMIHLPMGRFGEAVEIAKGALFCEYQSAPEQLRFNCASH